MDKYNVQAMFTYWPGSCMCLQFFFIFIRLAKNDLHIILASRIHASNQANKVSITLDEQEPSFFNTKKCLC